jgi:hypothetical protein
MVTIGPNEEENDKGVEGAVQGTQTNCQQPKMVGIKATGKWKRKNHVRNKSKTKRNRVPISNQNCANDEWASQQKAKKNNLHSVHPIKLCHYAKSLGIIIVGEQFTTGKHGIHKGDLGTLN